MRCPNATCRKLIDDDSPFCSYCGESITQPSVKPTASSKAAPKAREEEPKPDPFKEVRIKDDASQIVVLRAGRQIWHREEPESAHRQGWQSRPLLVVHEASTHLSHTTRQLNAQDLFARTAAIVKAQAVSVDVFPATVKWLSDEQEGRQRVCAQLRSHRFSDIKMLLGVDYLGQWATVNIQIAMEPLADVPPPESSFPWVGMVTGMISLAAFGSLVTGSGGLQAVVVMLFFGFLSTASFIVHMVLRRMALRNAEADERRRIEERLGRTFKVDDLRLFRSAMEVVFKAVVDDVVKYTGGKIEQRIEPTQGLFANDSEPSGRRSDAASFGL